MCHRGHREESKGELGKTGRRGRYSVNGCSNEWRHKVTS